MRQNRLAKKSRTVELPARAVSLPRTVRATMEVARIQRGRRDLRRVELRTALVTLNHNGVSSTSPCRSHRSEQNFSVVRELFPDIGDEE